MVAEAPRSPARPSAQDLRDVGIFGALSESVLDRFARELEIVNVAAGTNVFREGEPAREMYVLIDGEVEVLKQGKSGRDARVAILGPRDTFGEMALIDVQPRSATVRAVAPSRLMRLTSTDLDALYRTDLKSYALLTLNVARELSRRLRVADRILADLLHSVVGDYAEARRAARTPNDSP